MAHRISRLTNVKRVLDEIEEYRLDAKRRKLNFTAVNEEQLIRKLLRANSPMIIFQAWLGAASPGGSISYQFGVHNPDPTDSLWLYGYAFVGPANFVHDIGQAVAGRDRRYAELTTPGFPGQQLPAGATAILQLTLPIPSAIEATTYQGNTVLFRADWHDAGTYLDRGLWTFDIT